MKPTCNSSEQKRNKYSTFAPAVSTRSETALFGTLGLMALAAIVIALVEGSTPSRPRTASLITLKKLPLVTYVSSGELIADARTAAAAVRYLLEPEPIATNAAAPAPTQHNTAMPTNNAALNPKA
jgi:hypothetical protein